jgi:hypothetical protein
MIDFELHHLHRFPDTAFIHSIFLSAFQGDVVTVRELLNSSTTAPEYYLRPLTTISIHEGNPKLLRLCFEIGFRPAGYNDSDSVLYWRVRNNPSTAWLDVLFDYDFYHWRTDPQQLNKRQIWHYVFSMGPDCTRWWIDHGGCTPSARGLFEQPQRWPGATVFRILLDQFGINWFKNSGTLQLAAKNQDLETVKMLVEAGADVNEDVADWQWDIREHRAAPSPALNEAVYAKSEKTIRYLVEQGARLPRMYIDDPYNTIPEEYKIFKKLVVDLGGVEQENPS